MVVFGRQWASMGYDVLTNPFHGQGNPVRRPRGSHPRGRFSASTWQNRIRFGRRPPPDGRERWFHRSVRLFYCSSFVLIWGAAGIWGNDGIDREKGARRPVSRVLYPRVARVMAIHLGRPLPDASRDRPGRRRENLPAGRSRRAVPTWSCSRWGLPCRSRRRDRGALLPHPFTLAGGPEPKPGPEPAVCFLWHFPWGRPRRALPGTVFPWSPDFPPPAGRSPTEGGHPAVWHP